MEDDRQDLIRQLRVDALKKNLETISQEGATPGAVNSLFKSSKVLAREVIGLDDLASTIFAMSFGSAMLRPAGASIDQEAENQTSSKLYLRTRAYLAEHFNPNAEDPASVSESGTVFGQLKGSFRDRGISTDYIDSIYALAENIAGEIRADSSKLASKDFVEAGSGFPKRPTVIPDEQGYSSFVTTEARILNTNFQHTLDRIVNETPHDPIV